MEQIIWETIPKHTKNKKVTGEKKNQKQLWKYCQFLGLLWLKFTLQEVNFFHRRPLRNTFSPDSINSLWKHQKNLSFTKKVSLNSSVWILVLLTLVPLLKQSYLFHCNCSHSKRYKPTPSNHTLCPFSGYGCTASNFFLTDKQGKKLQWVHTGHFSTLIFFFPVPVHHCNLFCNYFQCPYF